MEIRFIQITSLCDRRSLLLYIVDWNSLCESVTRGYGDRSPLSFISLLLSYSGGMGHIRVKTHTLVLRDSELAYLLRSLIKLSPPPPLMIEPLTSSSHPVEDKARECQCT